ncbi:hypothetical protein [Kineosporia babensis]|uniref:Uncharacterized protein n=1 Tax=Kineosporia babensis TaxID=499548 RepID=A0A9X1N8N2_9ACTN|nr:hypothetical protein [Kineosporia babensis]MCD5309590.1 hypothetical protein [Kineosporia babensis]
MLSSPGRRDAGTRIVNALRHTRCLALDDRSEQLTAEASRHATDLAERSQELQSAQQLLSAALDRTPSTPSAIASPAYRTSASLSTCCRRAW